MDLFWLDYNPSDDVICRPGAARPNYDADLERFRQRRQQYAGECAHSGRCCDLKWSVNLATESDKWVSIGDPIIVNGEMFVTSNSELIRIDANGAIVDV